MRKIKVFISSVIEGYKNRRDAVEEATIELNRDGRFKFEVVRVDKFPAQDKSSQKACLDGVNESDIYLGIYGKGYGWKDSPVGLSPTHEEFREAKNKNPILVFVEDIPDKEREPEQREFFKEVEDYVDGRHRKKFKTVSDLKHEVYRALLDLMNADFEQRLPDYSKSLLQNLQNERERINREWVDDIEPLRISDIVQLELMEEQKDEKQKVEKSSRVNKSLTPSDALKEPRLLIVGNAGAGKSSLLQWISYTYAEQILKSQNLPVPVYLELKWYKESLLELIATSFRDNNVICNEEKVQDWIENGRFLFLLDGFDELDDPIRCLKDIKELISFSKENRFVVTTRRVDLPKVVEDLQFKKVEVKQLSDSQIELFIEKYLGKEKGSKLLKELEKYNLLKEARNPLILWFMILEFQGEEPQLSINRGMLFKNVIEHRFLKTWERKHAKEDNPKYTDLKITILSQLAFFMIAEGDSVKIEEKKAEEIIYRLLKEGRRDYKELGDTIKEQLLASHILIKVGTQVSFWHKSFQDYFAALELLKLFSRDPEDFVKRYATERWEESILFLVGIMDEPSDFVDRLIQPFWRYFLNYQTNVFFRLSLAAKCIGANNRVSVKTQQKVIEQLTRIIHIWESKGKITEFKSILCPILFYSEEAFQALGETKLEKAAELLGVFLENHESEYNDCGFCQWAVKALRNLPLTEKAQNSLLYAALWHKDEVVRVDATEILGGNMSQEIESKLLQVLSNRNEKCEVRRRALITLRGHYDVYTFIDISMKKKYSDEVIDTVVRLALEEECRDLQVSACNFLWFYRGEGKEKKMVNPLVHALLENPNAKIRANAAYALHFQSSHKVRETLIQALGDEDAKVKTYAAHTLKHIKIKANEEENEVSRKLFGLFSNENTDVRIEALWTFGSIRKNPTSEEVTQLINLLKDEELYIRWGAARALGFLKAKSALSALIQMVWDEKYDYPWAYAIWAAVQIEPGFSEVVKENGWEDAYIKDLHDDDADKRVKATEILEKIGTEKALPALKELCKDYKKNSGKERRAIQEIEERIRP